MRNFRPIRENCKRKGELATIPDTTVPKKFVNFVYNGNDNIATDNALRFNQVNILTVEHCFFKNFKGQGRKAIQIGGSISLSKNTTNIKIRRNLFRKNNGQVNFSYANMNDILVEKNRAKDFDFYLLNGVAGDVRATFCFFNTSNVTSTATKGVLVKSNKIHQITGGGHDVCNCFATNGTAIAPIEFSYNLVKGESTCIFPFSNFGGGGLVLGDDGGIHQKAFKNVFCNYPAFGIQLVSEPPNTNNITANQNIFYNVGRDNANGNTGVGFQISAFTNVETIKNVVFWEDQNSSTFIDSGGDGYTAQKLQLFQENNSLFSSLLSAIGANLIPSERM